MDSLYYSAPRPFNKYPRGYRPVTDSTQDLTRVGGGGGLRPSSSWSSFPQQVGSDQRSATLPHFPCASPISPLSPVAADHNTSNFNYWTADEPPRSRRPLRSESSSTVFDNNFSPRELSPLSVASEYCNNNPVPPPAPMSMYGHRSVQSPAPFQDPLPPRGYDNVPRPPSTYEPPPPMSVSTSQRESEFLRNLQRQKAEAHNMSSSWYAGDQSSRQPDWGGGAGGQNMNHQQQHLGQPQPQLQTQQPRRLAKTQSDLSFDSLNNTYFNNNSSTLPTRSTLNSPPSYQQQNQNHQVMNGNLSSAPLQQQSHRLDGFFRNRVIEPNWMTDPPPPKSFREDYIIRNIPLSTSLNSDFERFRLEPTYRETQGRASTEQPPNFRSYHRDSPEPQPQRGVSTAFHREPSPVRSPPVLSYAQQPAPFSFPNPINQVSYNNHNPDVGGPPKNVYQNVPPVAAAAVAYREKEREREQRDRPGSYYSSEQNNRNSAVYSNEPIRLTNDRVLRIHPHQSEPSYAPEEPHYPPPSQPAPQQSQRARIQSPLRDFARLTSPIREVAPLTRNPDRIFSPVESKVYNRTGPTVINGFTSNRHTYNSHTDDYDARNRRDSSQPPVAVIEPNINVHMPSDPIPYHKPHFGHGHPNSNHHPHQQQQHSHMNNHQHHHQNVQPVKPSYYQNIASPTHSTTFSPTSNYENDSDMDIEEMARRALPKYLRDDKSERGNLYGGDSGDNLHGILIKNPSLHRNSSKKVVFIDQEKASAGGAASGDVPPHVRAYDDAIEENFSKFASLSDEIGGDLVVLKTKMNEAFNAFRETLWTGAGKPEPNGEEVQKMLAPLMKIMEDVRNFMFTKKNTTYYNHINAVNELLPAFGWISVKKTPVPYIKEMIDASQFYINKILVEYKEKDPRHVEWVKAWKGIFEEMGKFVRQVHTTGFVWNSAPGAVAQGSSAPAPVAAPPAPRGPGGPPPPPPPPIPADLFANMPPPPPVDADKANRDALFASLNQGEAITSKLKKVTADMQTHKNPTLRGNVAAPATLGGGSGGSPAKAAAPVRKPPHKELENGKQWIIEYFVNDPNIVIDVADKKQTVYIFRCENSVIKVNGKANSITLDGCKKTSVVFDALVAQCETVNCQSVQIQTLGELPTLSIQKTDGCQVFLSKVAQGCEIVTSKSSEMNISVQTTDDGEYTEYPVPEQFKTTFVNGKLVTVVSDIC